MNSYGDLHAFWLASDQCREQVH